ncbi:hypothetical protein SteCoe_26511 [Stentor coeruleus]|uniref:Uncharacterized protein n=1 Tax=Stentor coeruleus TaxID=5963 RepID=A0A1R2BCR0_9CILI|nr:hypothetical protein SteCoe_26511 [Stentor coeruleus]
MSMQNYLYEITELKKKIQEKEKLIERLQKSPSPSSLYLSYNKDKFDQLKFEEQRKLQVGFLNSQLIDKNEMRMREIEKREQEMRARLDDLKRQKKEEYEREMLMKTRAMAYKEDLDTQQHLKYYIRNEESQEFKAAVPRQSEFPIQKVSPSPIYKEIHTTFTKKHPKTIFYNPITGDLRDSTNFVNGNFSVEPVHRQNDSLVLPQNKNMNRIAIEFSDMRAFQQPKYTKSHPKIIPTNTITGSPLNYGEFTQDIRDLSQKSQKSLRNYGKSILKPTIYTN